MSEFRKRPTPFKRLTGVAAQAAETIGNAANAASSACGVAAEAALSAGDAIASAATSASASLANAVNSEKINPDKPLIEHRKPNPLCDHRETEELDTIAAEFEKLKEPGALAKIGNAASSLVPSSAKQLATKAGNLVQAQDVYRSAMEIATSGFKTIEERAVRFSVSADSVLSTVNETVEDCRVESIDELCLLRSYDVARAAQSYRLHHLGLAAVEGAATGAPGLAGIPFNLVFSTFLYYRAVQSVALCYGYDVKESDAEMVIAGEVFMNALAPEDQEQSDGMSNLISKIMVASQITAVKQTITKGWTAMAQAGGASLLIVQLRALANASAQKALQKAGAKGLENGVFRNVFKQIGSKLSQNVVGKAVPVMGGVIGAAFDASQMNAILQYADLFYHRRFILEKESRIATLLGEGIYEPPEASAKRH